MGMLSPSQLCPEGGEGTGVAQVAMNAAYTDQSFCRREEKNYLKGRDEHQVTWAPLMPPMRVEMMEQVGLAGRTQGFFLCQQTATAQTSDTLFPPLSSQAPLPSNVPVSQWGQELRSPHLCEELWDLPGVAAKDCFPPVSLPGVLACVRPEGVWLLPAAVQALLAGREPVQL